MKLHPKKVLYISLSDKNYNISTHPDYSDLIGGIGIASRILLDNKDKKPVVFASGPLSGLFPFASKICLGFINDKGDIQEMYAGGKLAFVMRLMGFDAIAIYGSIQEPTVLKVGLDTVEFLRTDENFKLTKADVSGNGSYLYFGKNTLVDGKFSFGSKIPFMQNIKGMAFSGEGTIKLGDKKEYMKLYKHILNMKSLLSVSYSNNHACWGCPAGCELSKEGETQNIGVLPHSLVACQFAEAIYKDIPLVFSCLSVLGYKYNHDHLENLPALVGEIKKLLKK